MADFTPRSHLLESHTNNNMPWWQALSELIDNSLDAGAKRVSIEMTGKTLTVKDDGNGVEDVLALFRLGEHKRSKSTKLGRYGVGAKDAWLSCSDVMKVISVRNGIKTTLQVDYKSLIANNWQGDDPKTEDTELPNGTSLEFKLRAGKRGPQREAIDMVGWVFTPAILDGIQLLYGKPDERKIIRASELPDLLDVVDSEFDIDGKQVHIRIGILPDGAVMHRGPFWVAHGHRNITQTSIGVKSGSSQKLGGVITLGDGWKLSRHKDDLTENQDRLEDAIHARIEPILQKASTLAETLELATLRTEIQSLLDNAIDQVKEQRNKGATKGTASPANTGRKRENAEKVDTMIAGSVKMKSSKGKQSRLKGINFDWQHMDDVCLGRVDALGARVSLNTNNTFVSEMRKSGNAIAQVLCVCSLLADFESRHDGKGQKLLSFDYKDFSHAVGKLVSGVKGIRGDEKAAV